MLEPFELPVAYGGQEMLFPARLIQQGYIHKFEVEIQGMTVFFEPDEERIYRAMIDPSQAHMADKLSVPLLQAVADALEYITR